MKSEADTLFPPIAEAIQSREDAIFGRIQNSESIDEARELSKQFEIIDRMRKVLKFLADDYAYLWDYDIGEDGSSDVENVENGVREIRVEVTQGMLNQNLLTLTAAVKRGVVKLGEQMTITLPNPEKTTFTTEISEPGNKLRDRKNVRMLYQDNDIRGGDLIILKESSKGKWLASFEHNEFAHKTWEEIAKEYGPDSLLEK